MSELTILADARDLLAQGFCQGAFSRDIFGADIGAARAQDGAVEWCPEGALCVAAGGTFHWQYDLERSLAARAGATDLWRWADAPGRTQAEVLALFDEEIAALAEGRGEESASV